MDKSEIIKNRLKDVFNFESQDGKWEIWNNELDNSVTLHYVVEDNYSDKDIKINMPYEDLYDLIDFLLKLKQKTWRKNI